MRTTEYKNSIIEDLVKKIDENDYIYFANISNLDANNTNRLRRNCFKNKIKINVVKNTLLKKSLIKTQKNLDEINQILIGHTAILFPDNVKAPAKVFKEFNSNNFKLIIKGACIDGDIITGDNIILKILSIKSKNELLSDVILSIKSPINSILSILNQKTNNL